MNGPEKAYAAMMRKSGDLLEIKGEIAEDDSKPYIYAVIKRELLRAVLFLLYFSFKGGE